MALIKTLPSNRAADASYWRAVEFAVNTRNAAAPYATIELVGYTDQAAYESGALPLEERRVTVPTAQFVPLMQENMDTYSALALLIDTWLLEDYGTLRFESNPDFDPEAPAGPGNQPEQSVFDRPFEGATLV